MPIEVEIRSFISKQQYKELLNFFKKQTKLISEDNQETYYFDCPQDLRIQKSNFYSKVWLKKGKLHDEHREEIEIKLDKKEFNRLYQLFQTLGFNYIKFIRKRHTFEWDGIIVMIDYTKSYGYIIELEKKCFSEDKEKTLQLLKEKLKQLKIPLTLKEEFDKKFQYYKENWRKLIS